MGTFFSLKWRIGFQNGKLSLVFSISEISFIVNNLTLSPCVFSFVIIHILKTQRLGEIERDEDRESYVLFTKQVRVD